MSVVTLRRLTSADDDIIIIIIIWVTLYYYGVIRGRIGQHVNDFLKSFVLKAYDTEKSVSRLK